MKKLLDITLIGVDCVDINRLKFAADICEKDFEFGAVKLLSSIIDTDPRIVFIKPVNSQEEYSRFLIRDLGDFVDTKYVLVIQHDGFILNSNAWNDVFLQYDYIGAPWWYTDGMNVGNGGFSLRSKKLLEILRDADFITEFTPEDHHICRTYRQELENQGITFAPEALAATFSIEGGLRSPHLPIKYGNKWTTEFGFHGLDKTDLSEWFKLHPEYKNCIADTVNIKIF